MGQFGFFDADRRLAAISAKGDPLEMIARVVPFESFRAEIEAAVLTPASEKKSTAGRKPIDVMVMFRMLVLQSLYNLSDEQVEYQVRDRLSFTRFLGLGIVRARIEHVFGAQQNSPGGRIVRTIGIARAKAKIGLQNLAYNIRRLVTLERMAAA